MIPSQELISRFIAKCQRDPHTDTRDGPCNLWKGAQSRSGGINKGGDKVYGVFRAPITPSGLARAHRVAFWIVRGYLPSKIELDHRYECESTLCINPWHVEPTGKITHARKSNEDKKRARHEEDLEW